MKKKILSFSLWGNIRLYCIGAIKNAILAKKYFPGWICRFYYDKSVPECILDYLHSCDNTELVLIDIQSGGKVYKDNGQYGMLWRYYPFNDDDVEIWAARDIDSRISPYEKQVLDTFLQSNNVIHGIRDEGEPFARGGTLSFKNFNHGKDTRFVIEKNGNTKKLDILELTSYIDKKNAPFYTDEKFLINVLFPYYKNSYSWDQRKPNIEHPSFLGPYVCAVVDEYDKEINKNNDNKFNYKTNYDDLYELTENFKILIDN